MISDVRKSYSQKEKSTHEKIVLAKLALAQEKENFQSQVLEQISLNNFLNMK
jgi:hypothetical protein